jgi:hypothetical protein
MKSPHTFAARLIFVVPLACSAPGPDPVELTPQAAAGGQTFKIGVLVDDASPAKANFTGAALLAESQIARALSRSGIHDRFDIIVAPYAAGQAQNTAIDLINNQGALAVVSDISGNTAAVNRLNYLQPSPAAHKFTVTCYQCSSAFFNDPGQTDLGFADPENWLFRTFFNASFESAVQVQLVLNRPDGGDFDGDGHVKIVVYYDAFHLSAATTMPSILDGLHAGSHSVELIQKTLPSTPASRAAELAAIFDSDDGHAPDAVYLAFLPQNATEALSDYTGFTFSPKPPAQANNGVRRNFLLPSLLAAGGAGLEGSSVLTVSDTPSGALFQSAFVAATGQPPELTASYLYDAVVAQVIAIGWARSFGSVTPEVIQGNFPNINDPGGATIRPSVKDFQTAARRIKRQQPINYDGASSPLELTPDGEMYPDLVHWRIQGGQFVELERYRCDPDHPSCEVRP